MKKSLSLALLASMASMLPFMAVSAAHAQSYSHLIVFGDSLSDNGNLFTATGSPPAPYNKRFTNDKVWAEYLAGSLQSFFTPGAYAPGNYDLAWGGARSDSATNSNGPIPGTPTQIASYLGHGGSFGANDIASVWIGANDIFQALPTAAANPGTAAAYMENASATAAGNAGSQVGQLAAAGAKTIIVMNLPDLGSTPQFNTDPTTAALTTLSSSTYNGALAASLKAQAAAHSGTNIIQVDIQSAFTAIIANPGAFGISNVTQGCVLTTACVTAPIATQNTYLFWDGVHPTETGHKLIAQMVAQYIYTPTLTEGVGMFADETYEVRRANAASLADVLHGVQGSEGDTHTFVQVVGSTGSRNKDIAMQTMIGANATLTAQKAYDFNMAGIRAGAVHAMSGDMSFGVSATALTGDSKAFMVSAKPTDVSIDLGWDWRPGGYFISASAGGGFGSYTDYTRATMLAPLYEHINQVNASSMSASIQTGFDNTMGSWTVTPLARLSYVEATQKGFDELGAIAAVSFGDRKVSGTSGTLEVRARGQLSSNVAFTGELGYEGVLSGTEGDLDGKLINNTAQAFATDMGKVGSPGMLVGLGLSTKIGGMNVSARYSGTFGSQDQKTQSAIISLDKSF